MPDKAMGDGFVIRDSWDSEKKSDPGKDKKNKEISLDINFSTFILSLGSSAMLNFGEIPDPMTGKKEKNLPMAKQTIDILSMLQEKTKGNLAEEEFKLLENLLADLRMQYVQFAKKG